MPHDEYEWLPRHDILTFEEIETVVRAFVGAGVRKVRLTGGEPLLRRGLPDLVERLARIEQIDDIALTTNGTLLADHAAALMVAGLHRVTISLDTLRPERHHGLTRRDNHDAVLAGIDAVRRVGFTGTKINAVVMAGVNDDEIGDLLAFASDAGAELRFIEYMDVDGATSWQPSQVVSSDEMLATIAQRHGPIEPVSTRSSAPARRYRTADGTQFGIVPSTTTPFCASCDRARLTADGTWYRCLYAATGSDLRAALRNGATRGELRDRIVEEWSERDDQGAVDRLALAERRTPVPVQVLRRDPHREMHTRGG